MSPMHTAARRRYAMSTQRSTSSPELLRALGPVDATCVVVGAIIGVGIFFTPSRVSELAGSANLALLAWAVGGGIALMGALTFAELGGLYPRTGGQYIILRDAFGPFVAFLFVFCNATAVQAGAIAIIGIVCARHLGLVVGHEAMLPAVQTSLAAILVIALMVANSVGVRWGSRIQNVTVFAKVATLIAVTILAMLFDAQPPQDASAAGMMETAGLGPLGPLGAVAAALVPVSFSFGGWQHALWIAGEVRRPGRNVPLAILGGVAVVIAAYLSVNWAYLDLLGFRGVAKSNALAADAVALAWPSIGRRVVAGAVALSAFGVLNTQLLTGPRLIYGMAGDGRFFRPFSRVSARFSTPVTAIVLLGGIALALLLTAGADRVDRILTGAVLIDGLFFAATGAALVVLRRKRPSDPRPVRVPGYPVVPLLFVAGELAIVAGAYADPNVRGAAHIAVAWVLGAAACYAIFFRTPLRSKTPTSQS